MAVAKKKKSKFIVRKSKKTGQKIKLYGGPMIKVLAAEKARKRKRNSISTRAKSVKKTRNSAAKVKIVVRKNGKRVYGAAANAVLRKRNAPKRNARTGKLERLVRVAGGDRLDDAYKILANPRRNGLYKTFKAYSKVQGTRRSTGRNYTRTEYLGDVSALTKSGALRLAKRKWNDDYGSGITVKLSRRNPRAAKRNSALVIVNPKRKRNGLYETFHGEEVRKITTDLAPDGTPNNVDILGKIDRIYFRKCDSHVNAGGKTSDWIDFGTHHEERPKLASNQAGNRFYIVGNLTPFTPNGSFGEITRLEYCARKPHIEGHDKEVGYWHKLGEENGVRPTLETDHEGYLVIKGGDYRTTADGIIN